MLRNSMVRKMICAFVIIIILTTFFNHYLETNNDKEHEFNIHDSVVTGPYLNDLPDDQTLIGGFTDNNNTFFHIYYEHRDSLPFQDEDFIYSYNNNTGERELLFSDEEIRDWDLFNEHLWVYNIHNFSAGAGLSHKLTYVNVETGREHTIGIMNKIGPGMDDDEFIIAGSAGRHSENESGVFDFFLPVYGDSNEKPREWDFIYHASGPGAWDSIEDVVKLEEIAGGDASDKNGTGYLTLDGILTLYQRIGDSKEFDKVLVISDIIDFSLRYNNIAVVNNNGVYISTFDNPSNLKLVEGTEGAQEVDVYEDFLLVTKLDGTYLFHSEGEFIMIYSERITDIWLHELEGSLLRAGGTFSGDGDDSGHIDIELDI